MDEIVYSNLKVQDVDTTDESEEEERLNNETKKYKIPEHTDITEDNINKSQMSSEDSLSHGPDDMVCFSFGEENKENSNKQENGRESMIDCLMKELEDLSPDVKDDMVSTLNIVKLQIKQLSHVLDQKSSLEEDFFELRNTDKDFVSQRVLAVEEKSVKISNQVSDLYKVVSKMKNAIKNVGKQPNEIQLMEDEIECSWGIQKSSFLKYRDFLLEYIGKRLMSSFNEILTYCLEVVRKSHNKNSHIIRKDTNDSFNLPDRHAAEATVTVEGHGDALTNASNIIKWLNVETSTNENWRSAAKLYDTALKKICCMVVEDFSNSFGRLFQNIDILFEKNSDLYQNIFPARLEIDALLQKVSALGNEGKALGNYLKHLPEEICKRVEKLEISAHKKSALLSELEDSLTNMRSEVCNLSHKITNVETSVTSSVESSLFEFEIKVREEIEALKVYLDIQEHEIHDAKMSWNTENVTDLNSFVVNYAPQIGILEEAVQKIESRLASVTQDEPYLFMTQNNATDNMKMIETISDFAKEEMSRLTDAVTSTSMIVQDYNTRLLGNVLNLDSELSFTANKHMTLGEEFIDCTLEKLKALEGRLSTIDSSHQKIAILAQPPELDKEQPPDKDIHILNKSNILTSSNGKENQTQSLIEKLRRYKESYKRDLTELRTELEAISQGIDKENTPEKRDIEISTEFIPFELDSSDDLEDSYQLREYQEIMDGIAKRIKTKSFKTHNKFEQFPEEAKPIILETPTLNDLDIRGVDKTDEHENICGRNILFSETCHQIKFSDLGYINVFVYGDLQNQDGKSLITIHDVGKNHTSFHSLFLHGITETYSKQFTWIQVDFPGHEGSGQELSEDCFPTSLENFAEDLTPIFHKFKLKNVIGVAEGVGVNVLLRLYLLRPTHFKGLFLINPTITTRGYQEPLFSKSIKWSDNDNRLTSSGKKVLMSHWLGRSPGWSPKRKMRGFDKLWPSMNVSNMKKYLDLFVSENPLLPLLEGKIKCFTTVISDSSSLHCTQSKQLYHALDAQKTRRIKLKCEDYLFLKALGEMTCHLTNLFRTVGFSTEECTSSNTTVESSLNVHCGAVTKQLEV